MQHHRLDAHTTTTKKPQAHAPIITQRAKGKVLKWCAEIMIDRKMVRFFYSFFFLPLPLPCPFGYGHIRHTEREAGKLPALLNSQRRYGSDPKGRKTPFAKPNQRQFVGRILQTNPNASMRRNEIKQIYIQFCRK